jgi:hypothetical protein
LPASRQKVDGGVTQPDAGLLALSIQLLAPLHSMLTNPLSTPRGWRGWPGTATMPHAWGTFTCFMVADPAPATADAWFGCGRSRCEGWQISCFWRVTLCTEKSCPHPLGETHLERPMRCVSGLGAACGFFPAFAKTLRVQRNPARGSVPLYRPSGKHARVDTQENACLAQEKARGQSEFAVWSSIQGVVTE